MQINKAKQAAGTQAADWVQSGMIVGLGTGSTAFYFIQRLIERAREGLQIEVVASSRASAEIAQKGGLRLLDMNAAPHIDFTADGADEIDAQKRMIKGGGGAHVREKILAAASREWVAIVDETKVVDRLGKAKLPVEILLYGSPATRGKIEALGYTGKWRLQADGSLFLSENGNLLFDIYFPSPPTSPEQVHEALIHLPGVVDTGFFFHMAHRVIVGFPDGSVQVRK